MRFRTLYRPENVKVINEKMVPVAIVVTDIGYPFHLPVFLKYEAYSANPWPHFRSSHIAIVNSEGSRIYASTGSQMIEAAVKGGGFSDADPALQKGLERFYREKVLLKKIAAGDTAARKELQHMRDEIARELDFIMVPLQKDVRLMTAHFLQDKGPDSWPAYLKRYRYPPKGKPDIIGEKVRRLTTFALGEFISDDRPFKEETRPYLKVIYENIPPAEALATLASIRKKIADSEEPGRPMTPADFPVPRSLRMRAARSIEDVYGLDFGDDKHLLQRARTWWKKNRQRFVPSAPVPRPEAFGTPNTKGATAQEGHAQDLPGR